MAPRFTIPLALVLIVSALLAAATDQATTSSGGTGLSTADNTHLNAVLDFRVFTIKEFTIARFSVPVPMVNLSFFLGLFELLTWDFSYFDSTWNLLRWPLMAITFTVGILVLISIGPVIVAVASFFTQTALGAVRAVFRLGV